MQMVTTVVRRQQGLRVPWVAHGSFHIENNVELGGGTDPAIYLLTNSLMERGEILRPTERKDRNTVDAQVPDVGFADHLFVGRNQVGGNGRCLSPCGCCRNLVVSRRTLSSVAV